LLLLVGKLSQVVANTNEKIAHSLVEIGFENVRVGLDEKKCILTFENPVYRWNVSALVTALDILVFNLDEPRIIEIILLDKGIPKIALTVESAIWGQFRRNEIIGSTLGNHLFITEETSKIWGQIKNEMIYNRHNGKTDFVLYPQLAFENTLLARLYEVQFNIAPAIQLSLWKGMNFTGQIIFPIYNDLGFEGDYIRPGQIVLSQNFKVHRINGNLSFGNFSSSRYGADLSVRGILPNENWNLKLNAGYTGSSHFFNHQWIHSPINTFSWSMGATWFFSNYNMEFEGGLKQYIYGDIGVYGTCTRRFGEIAIGFYAMASDVSTNGGFLATIPYPFKKRNRNHNFRVVLPEYQDFIYNAGTEFYYGQSYRVGPEKNDISQFFNAAFIKNQIINHIFNANLGKKFIAK